MDSEYQQFFQGWGNYPRSQSSFRAPELPQQVFPQLDSEGTIARGLGRSYGDPALNANRRVLDCTQLNRYLEFDPNTGILVCESGVSLGRIIQDFAPRGFFPMVTPGTKHVTVGGCIANDVHGKAHHVDGCFSRCVDSFSIMLANGQVEFASRTHNSDLFWANFGGMGLLGVILTAKLHLRPIETTWFKQKPVVVRNLDELLDALHANDKLFPYSVAWVDPLAKGKRLGRGVLTVGDHAKLDELPESLRGRARFVKPPTKLRVPCNLPSFSLNSITSRILNTVLGYVQRNGAEFAHYEKFFYPLDFVDSWNRGYGTKGFTQYQFVVPLEDGRRRIRELLDRITRSKQLPFLNVLKKFGDEESNSVLSFPREGYTFAIDFPIRSGLREFLAELDRMVIDAGGRVYLGKDAFLDRDRFSAMYSDKLETWHRIKARYDPENVFNSDLGRRVGLCRADP